MLTLRDSMLLMVFGDGLFVCRRESRCRKGEDRTQHETGKEMSVYVENSKCLAGIL